MVMLKAWDGVVDVLAVTDAPTRALRDAWLRELAAEQDAASSTDGAEVARRVTMYEAAAAVVRRIVVVDAAAALHCASKMVAAAPGETRRTAEAALFHAVVLDERGDLLGALGAVEASRRVATQLRDPAITLMATMLHGRLLVKAGSVGPAVTTLLRGINLAQRAGTKLQEARMLGNLGFLYAEDDGAKYEDYTRRALALARTVGDPQLLAHTLCNLGCALVQQERFAAARLAFSEGLPIAMSLGWEHGVALFFAGMGGLEARTGNLDLARQHYERSSASFLVARDYHQVARQRMILAQHLLEAGRIAEARAEAEATLAMRDIDGFRSVKYRLLELLSQILEKSGDAAGALCALRRSVQERQAMLAADSSERERMVSLQIAVEEAKLEAEWQKRRADALEQAVNQERERDIRVDAGSRVDALTGLVRRFVAFERIAAEVSRARRQWRPMAVLRVNIDALDMINRVHGRAVGDEVIAGLARRMEQAVREHDVVARWEGDGYCIVLPDTEGAAAADFAKRLTTLSRATAIFCSVATVWVTVSVGLAQLQLGDRTADDVLARADAALRTAKTSGRDRVVIQGPPDQGLAGSL